MDKDQVRLAARKLCMIRGANPDMLVSVDDFFSYVGDDKLEPPCVVHRWEIEASEIKRHLQLMSVISAED